MSAVIPHPIFGRPGIESALDTDAGSAAHRRAISLGYSNIVAAAFRRTAKRERFPGESAEATALRIVPRMPDSAHGWRGRGPELSA